MGTLLLLLFCYSFLLLSRPRPPEKKTLKILYFEPSKSFWGYMMKIKNVGNVILKVLIYVRTHPEEALAPKNENVVFRTL